MPRLNVVDPKQATGRVKEIFAGPLEGMHLNIFRGMANSPAALEAYLGMSGALKTGVLSDAEREVIALALAEANDCEYCRAAHTGLGKMVGLSAEQTIGARKGTLGDPKLTALARFTQQMNEKRGWVDDADVQALRDVGYGDAHLAEIVATYALNTYTNYFNHLNQTEVDMPPAPALP
jgi:uncharacterized peroxidase-related enzyme